MQNSSYVKTLKFSSEYLVSLPMEKAKGGKKKQNKRAKEFQT